MKKRTLLCYAIASLTGIANAGTVELQRGPMYYATFQYEMDFDFSNSKSHAISLQCVQCARDYNGINRNNCMIFENGIVPTSKTTRMTTPGYVLYEYSTAEGWGPNWGVKLDTSWTGEREQYAKVWGEVACALDPNKYPYYSIHAYINGVGGDLSVTGDINYHTTVRYRGHYSPANPIPIPGATAGGLRVSYADELTLTAGETKKLLYDV
ncbi:TPA: hypothetical protein JZG27_005104, partial [Escherichia coli]|nr:hypothetical protein [Escherichia coli]